MPLRDIAVRTFAGLCAGLFVNLHVLYLFKHLAPDFVPLSFIPITLATVVGIIGAGVAYILVARYSQNPRKTFLMLSFAVLMISFIPNLVLLAYDLPGMEGKTPEGVLALMTMHVTTMAAAVTALLYRPTLHVSSAVLR